MSNKIDLDLDINNYNQQDIEKFFKLHSKKDYSNSDISYKVSHIREQLLQSGHIHQSMKRDFIRFLDLAKEKLIHLKRNVQEHIPTSLPFQPKLDSTIYHEDKHHSREPELNKRERTQFIHTQNSDFLPGKVNPLHTRVISKCLTVDTRYRSNYNTTTSTDFNFHMPVILNRVVSMQLSSFEIPVSFYGISESYGNNFLYIQVQYTNPEESYEEQIYKIFTIPDGNYNAQSFIDTINAAINPNWSDINYQYSSAKLDYSNGDTLFYGIKFLLGIDQNTGSGTGKVFITCQEPAITSINFNFLLDKYGNIDNLDISTKMGWNLGFNKSIYTFNTPVNIPPTYAYGYPSNGGGGPPSFNISSISDTLIEPATIRYIYLAIDDYNNSVNDLFMTAFYESVMSPDVIARISIKGPYFTLLMENDLSVVTEPRIYFGPVDIQRLRVRLYDDKGRILQMNNANYSFCLVFKMLYDL